jgi:hypothetical protein
VRTAIALVQCASTAFVIERLPTRATTSTDVGADADVPCLTAVALPQAV